MARDKKLVPNQIFKRDRGNERRSSEIRPQSTTPTSGIQNHDNKSISPPKSRQREISWVDYEDLIKARQDEKDVVSPKSRSRSPSPISRASSRGKSPSGNRSKNRSKNKEVKEDYKDDFDEKYNVKFLASLPVQPKETLPFPFLRRTSQISLPRERRQSSFGSFSLQHGKRYQGELFSEDGRSIVCTPRVPGDSMWRDAIREPPSINEKLDLERFAMQIPQYLIDMRGDSRRSSLRALSIFGERLNSHRRSAFVRSVMASTNIDKVQSTLINNKYVTIAPKARLSTVIVPVNAKQWLLQIMCQKDLQLRELFNQMDLVPQFAGDHVREVRAEWEAQEEFQMQAPFEAETLIKDKTLIDKVKGLLAHFNEPYHNISPEVALIGEEIKANEAKEIEEKMHEQEMEEPHTNQSIENKNRRKRSTSKMFQGFERDREGSLSPVFGLGASLCPLCGQIQKKSFGRDGQLSFPNPTKLVDSDGDTRRTYLSFNDKRWIVVLFPALQPGSKDKIELLGEWLRYAISYNNCEDYDGQFADVDSAFILHSIAYLEVVRQVMIRVEPKLVSMLKETSSVQDAIFVDKQKNDRLFSEISATTNNIEVSEVQLRDKEFQWSQLKRCRLCTRSSHERMHLKGSLASNKHGLNIGDFQGEDSEKTFQKDKDNQGNEDGSLGEGKIDIGGASSKPGGDQGGSGFSNFSGHGGSSGIDGSLQGKHQGEDLEAYKPGKISEDFLHQDGLYKDVGTQTDPDTTGRSLFYNILKRPVSAPGRLLTTIMEEFQLAGGVVHRDLAEGEVEVKKEPQVIGLTAEDIAMLEATDDMAEEDEIGSIDKHALKNLANDSIHILEKIPDDQIESKMAESLFGLLGRFRNLKVSGQNGEEDDEQESSKKKSKTKPKDLPNIPLGFSKMMKINPPPKMVKLFNEHQVVKLVDAVYLKKIEADAIDDAQGNDRQNACEFLYDFMLNSYGLKGLAESAIHGVFKRIKQMMIKGIDKSHKLRLFQQFCGFDPLRGYGEPDFYLYLRCLSKAQSKVGVLFPTENEDGTYINTNPNQTDILLEEPTLMAQFRDNKDVAVDFLEQYAAANGFTEKVSNEVQKLVKSPTVRKLDFDLLMEAIIEVSPHKADYKKPQTKVKAITKAAPPMSKEASTLLETLFKAGDANQDGVLTFNEFREIIDTADSSVSETKALRMFRETLQLMPDGGDSISPSAFATVAHSNGIQATPAMIYDLLKKTWLQIQDDVNEEKFVDEDKKKDCEDMRTKLQDMLKERKPAIVFNAVEIFSTFVLKFCGEVKGAEEVLDESEVESIED
ncbi:hypothetical protein M758_5G091300 [Ceratodon purpureus]|nr:hypothetical protein M758_5G091300 [Ceratodon purpureus]